MSQSDSAFIGPTPVDAFKPGSVDKSLEVGIVGAGIAGLAAAVALRHSGHTVEVGEDLRVIEIGFQLTMS